MMKKMKMEMMRSCGKEEVSQTNSAGRR